MQIGVVGAGTMGIGIAHAFVTTGAEVVLVEPVAEQRAAAMRRIDDVLAAGVKRGKIDASAAEAAMGRMTAVAGVDELPERLGLVIEAVPERADLKRSVLAAVEARSPSMIGTNTSSISIDSLAAGLARPAQFLGMHFFNPVWSMALVELVTGSSTSADTVREAEATVAGLGKQPIVVKDVPGFATSRLGIALGLEAIRMLEQGVASADDIDLAMTLGYNHPMGPLRLGDLVGLDVRLDIARYLQDAYGDRFKPPDLLVDMVAAGRLGQKTGQGFFTW